MRLLVVAFLGSLLLARQPGVSTPVFQSADANEWMEAVAAHRPGEDDAALRKIAGWPGDRLLRALAVVRQAPASDQVNALLERAALLHADLSFLRDTVDLPAPEFWPGVANALIVRDGRRIGAHLLDPHIPFGRRILAAIRVPVSERARSRTWQDAHARNPRIRQWYRATSAYLAYEHWIADLQPHLVAARAVLAGDAGHHFDAGCLAELIASPQIQQTVPKPTRELSTMGEYITVQPHKELTAGHNLPLAEKEYRDALKIDPAYDEARVRLARVLLLQGQRREALTLLEAPSEPREAPVRYYRLLILGDALERDGRPRDARQAYARAAGLFPMAQSALVPTIRLARELGDDSAGRSAAARMAALPRGESQRPDPWWLYYDCNGRNREREIAALRQLFRGSRP